MSAPRLRFDWSSPSPLLKLGNVTTLTLATKLQGVEEEKGEEEERDDEDGKPEGGEEERGISLTDLRLEFSIEEEQKEDDEEEDSGKKETYAFFVGSRVFKHSQVFHPEILSESNLVHMGIKTRYRTS